METAVETAAWVYVTSACILPTAVVLLTLGGSALILFFGGRR